MALFGNRRNVEADYIRFIVGFEELSDFKLIMCKDLVKAATRNMYPPEYELALKEVFRRRGMPYDS